MPQPLVIEVGPWDRSPGVSDLFGILEHLFSVQFRLSPTGLIGAQADLMADEEAAPALDPLRSNRSSLRVLACHPAQTSSGPATLSVQFGDDPGVPFPFRGRRVRTNAALPPAALQPQNGERILASVDGRACWLLREEQGVKHYRSGFALPGLRPEEILRDVLNGERFIELLPLLHWLREKCGVAGTPPLRACFVFDDPNLHWTRYGYLDFREVAARAEKENYHVSFATIPLDAWFVHQPTAVLFRQNAARLSLCVHGNDHTKKELSRPYTDSQRRSLLHQANHRIQRLERRSGLQVARVMIPPHGACSEEMLAALPLGGFEAACISHGSLRSHNRGKPWTRALGYAPSEVILGCPVFPRWGMAGNCENTILLAAFLNQAIVLRGHHEDVKQGIEVLDNLARFINGLGSVAWSNLSVLSRSNYLWRQEASKCVLKPLSGKVQFTIPADTQLLAIESAFNGQTQKFRISRRDGKVMEIQSGQSLPLHDGLTATVLVESTTLQEPASCHPGRLSPLALVRRLATEGRDRLLS